MEGTNRKEMRKLFNKYVALMKVAFDNKINMDINTRMKAENNRPWFTGHVYIEDADFNDNTRDGIDYLFFTCYEWRDVADNELQLKAVEKFIENNKK